MIKQPPASRMTLARHPPQSAAHVLLIRRAWQLALAGALLTTSAVAQGRWKPDTSGRSLTLSEARPTALFLFLSHASPADSLERRLCVGSDEGQRKVIAAVADTLQALGIRKYVVETDTLSLEHAGRDTVITPYDVSCQVGILLAPHQPLMFIDLPTDMFVRIAVDYFVPQLRAHRVERIRGCYRFGYGYSGVPQKKRAEWGVDSLPTLVSLDSDSFRRFDGTTVSTARPLKGKMNDHGKIFYWYPIGDDSVALVFGNGFYGLGMGLAVHGRNLIGKMSNYQDVTPADHYTWNVVAHRTACR